MDGFVQVPEGPVDGGWKQARPRRKKPPHPNGGYSQLGNYLNMQTQPPDGGFEQVNPPDAGFEQVRDKDNPAARAYAKQRLMALVHRGVLPRYLPEWDRDPTAAWRAVSKMVFQPQQQDAGLGGTFGGPSQATPQFSGGDLGGPPPGSNFELPTPAATPTMGSADMGGVDEALKQLIGQALLKRRGTRSAPGVA